MISKQRISEELKRLETRSQALVLDSKKKDIPIVCSILDEDGNLVSCGQNRVEEMGDVTSHAELNAIRNGKRHDYKNCVLLVNLEPCLMCLGAILTNNFSDVYYLVKNTESGGFTKYNIQSKLMDHFVESPSEEAKLKNFFKRLR